jgi:hypothetical protein
MHQDLDHVIEVGHGIGNRATESTLLHECPSLELVVLVYMRYDVGLINQIIDVSRDNHSARFCDDQCRSVMSGNSMRTLERARLERKWPVSILDCPGRISELPNPIQHTLSVGFGQCDPQTPRSDECGGINNLTLSALQPSTKNLIPHHCNAIRNDISSIRVFGRHSPMRWRHRRVRIWEPSKRFGGHVALLGSGNHSR